LLEQFQDSRDTPRPGRHEPQLAENL
jgi:hypothetical protein